MPIDIALRNSDLSIIGIAQGFSEVIAYRYRFSAETFIVPITGCMYKSGTALLIKLRHCFIKHNGKERNSRNNAIRINSCFMTILQNQIINDKVSSTSK